MGRIESVKRTIILQMSLIGLVFQTVLYIYVWHEVYNDIMQSGMWRSFHRKGFWLLAAVYFILLLFFTATYGGLKVGYLKPMDVFFAGDFAVVCQHCLVFSDFPVVLGTGHSVPFDLDDACADCGVCGVDFVSHKLYQRFFPPKNLLFISGGGPRRRF